MTEEMIAHSKEHDELFEKYGGTLCMSKKAKEPGCGFRAIYEYAKKTGESLPISPERSIEIEALLTSREKSA